MYVDVFIPVQPRKQWNYSATAQGSNVHQSKYNLASVTFYLKQINSIQFEQ